MPIEVVRCVDDQAWDDFVGHNPHSNIFHTRQFSDCFKESKKYVPYCFFLEDDRALTACLIALQSRILGPVLESVASRSVVFGGILYSEEANQRYLQRHIGSLVHAYDDALRGKALYSEIRNISDATELILPLVDSGHRFVPHLNYLIDLSQGDEYVWNNLSQALRRAIRGTIKSGVEVLELSDEAQLATFSDLVAKTYAKVHIPCFDLEVFTRVWRGLSPLGWIRITFARHEGHLIAARAALIYRGRVFDWFAGSNVQGDSLNANPLLAWEMMQWSCRNGHRVFDFGGAGDPNRKYSVREFKRRFKGQLVNFGRFEKIYSPVLYSLGYVVYNALRRIAF